MVLFPVPNSHTYPSLNGQVSNVVAPPSWSWECWSFESSSSIRTSSIDTAHSAFENASPYIFPRYPPSLRQILHRASASGQRRCEKAWQHARAGHDGGPGSAWTTLCCTLAMTASIASDAATAAVHAAPGLGLGMACLASCSSRVQPCAQGQRAMSRFDL